jgi:hypothetical protein
MKASIEVNTAEFMRQVEAVVKVGKLTAAQALNRNAIKVLIGAKGVKGAVQLTRKATPARIRRDLNNQVTSWALGGGTHSTKLLWTKATKLLVKQGKRLSGRTLREWNTMVSAAAKRIADARDASRAFLAAGWLNCVRDLGRTRRDGGNGRSIRGVHVRSGGKSRTGGSAEASYAKMATLKSLEVICYNAAAEGEGAESIVQTALNQAIANATADMEVYTKRKIEEEMARQAAVASAQRSITIRV